MLCIFCPLGRASHQNNSSSENVLVLRQLSESISYQNKNATTTNMLMEDNMLCLKEKEEMKKDRLKKFHPLVLKMLKMTSLADGDNKAENIIQICKHSFWDKDIALHNCTIGLINRRIKFFNIRFLNFF